LALAKTKSVKFLLPVDDLEADELKTGAQSRNTPARCSDQGITDEWQAADIGRETIAQYKVEIRLRPFSGTAQLGFLKFQISQPALESSPKLSRRQVRKPSLEPGIR
jgi:hypothetical protein